MQVTSRSTFLDFLKGVAIIAVILFHAGIFTYGYLGVEIFLVVAGYLTTKSIVRSLERGNFGYWRFIFGRMARLWPLVVVVCAVSLLLGYFLMLPDSYKNTAETALGSLLFLNNLIQYITAGDYWDVSNDFKPLMHTWYVGLLVQFYVVFPLILMLTHRFAPRGHKSSLMVLLVIGLISLIIYLLPQIPTAVHFYMLPSRLFEFMCGGCVALLPCRTEVKHKDYLLKRIGLLLLILIIASGLDIEHGKLVVILMVALTAWLLYLDAETEQAPDSWNVRWIVQLGVASYSLYLWHQVFLAFYRYCVNYDLSVGEYVLLIGGSLIIGYLSYLLIEKPLDCVMKNYRLGKQMVLGLCLIFVGGLGFASFRLYTSHGVVRDVPELDIVKNRPSSWEPQEYNSAVYGCNIEFPHNGRKNVLVVGDSYGRDWYNVLREAGVGKSMNLSYRDTGDSVLSQRIERADYVFLATHGDYSRFKDYLPKMMTKKFYRVGDKKFFSTAGVIYNHGRKGYYQQVVRIPEEIVRFNQQELRIFGDKFINPMDVMMNSDGTCRIYTPSGKLISHDGLHLTRAGAQYYANHLSFEFYK